MAKKRVAILFGGKSAEHEVSLMSAKSIFENIDKSKYDVCLIGVDKEGHWALHDGAKALLNAHDPKLIALNKSNQALTLDPGAENKALIETSSGNSIGNVDVVFSVMHGTIGEDGSMQGLLRTAGIAFVGPSVLSSAVGMDKDVSKRLLRDAQIPVAKFITLHRHQISQISFQSVSQELGLPLFIKPANTGSSVGIHKVKSEKDFDFAISDAFKYDTKILIEEFIKGREIEISVLGNENPIASLPGEVIPHHDFYSYEAKYIDENGAVIEIPAKLDKATIKRVQELAIKTFTTLCCEGLARVDFFLTESGELYLNEINTLPGFTKISMYPKMWDASGIGYSELIDKLIQLALERHERDKNIKTHYTPQ
ncbi:MAG: D-alanine--D-alanine ligase [Bdellovibrionales bacterium]